MSSSSSPQFRDVPAHSQRHAVWREYPQVHPLRVATMAVVGLLVFVVVRALARRLEMNPGGLGTETFPNAGASVLALVVALVVDVLLLVAFALHDRAVARGAYHSADRHQVLSPVLRPFAWLVVIPSLLGLALLATRVANGTGPLSFDTKVDGRIIYHFSGHRRTFSQLIQLGSPGMVIILSIALAVVCLALRQVRSALLAVTGPPAAAVLSEYILKPIVGRHVGILFNFPSGHATGAIAVATTITLFILPGGAFARLPNVIRLALAGFVAVLVSTVPIGLIVLRYHFTTDVIAGAAVAVSVVLLIACALDGVARRRRPSTAGPPAVS